MRIIEKNSITFIDSSEFTIKKANYLLFQFGTHQCLGGNDFWSWAAFFQRDLLSKCRPCGRSPYKSIENLEIKHHSMQSNNKKSNFNTAQNKQEMFYTLPAKYKLNKRVIAKLTISIVSINNLWTNRGNAISWLSSFNRISNPLTCNDPQPWPSDKCPHRLLSWWYHLKENFRKWK